MFYGYWSHVTGSECNWFFYRCYESLTAKLGVGGFNSQICWTLDRLERAGLHAGCWYRRFVPRFTNPVQASTETQSAKWSNDSFKEFYHTNCILIFLNFVYSTTKTVSPPISQINDSTLQSKPTKIVFTKFTQISWIIACHLRISCQYQDHRPRMIIILLELNIRLAIR